MGWAEHKCTQPATIITLLRWSSKNYRTRTNLFLCQENTLNKKLRTETYLTTTYYNRMGEGLKMEEQRQYHNREAYHDFSHVENKRRLSNVRVV